jgi:hypothetical protein
MTPFEIILGFDVKVVLAETMDEAVTGAREILYQAPSFDLCESTIESLDVTTVTPPTKEPYPGNHHVQFAFDSELIEAPSQFKAIERRKEQLVKENRIPQQAKNELKVIGVRQSKSSVGR